MDFYTYIRNIYGGDTLSTAKATEPESSNSTKTAVSATPVQPDTPIALNRVALFYAHDLLPAYASQSRSTLAFSANSALLLAGGWDNTLEIWSIAEARRYPSLLVPTHATALTTMATQGNVLIYAAMDGGVNRLRLDAFGRIEPPQGNETWELLRHKGAVTAVQLTADGRWLVTGSQDGAVYQYDLQTNQSRTLRNDPTDPIAAVALNPTRPLVAYVGAKRSIALWHRMTEMVSSLPTEHTGSINTLQFSPDGLRIMTASSDGTVCIWQLANATRSHCFSDFTVGVNSALYTPDGALIVAAGNDGFIRVWDATSYRLLGAFNAHSGGVATLAMRADGRQLASAGWDGSIALWDLDLPSNLLKR
ncbi:MAG: WD40 repeat domain-containing protein [Caldilineaceae bacterium]